LTITVPAPSPALQPTLQAVVSPAIVTPAAVIPSVQPLAVRIDVAQALTRNLPNIPVSGAPKAAAQSFSLLTGESSIRRDESLSVLAAASASEPAPLPPSTPRAPNNPESARSVRRMMLGTAAMKSGMETVTLSVPLLALTALGGASVVAALVVAYGVSQAVFAGAAGSLADRFSARKVLAGAVVAQAALVGVVVALGAFHALGVATLLPLYILIGGAVGIAETTRHSIPALILGQDGDALNKYNARLHIAYESAGVAGALAAGALIAFAGPLWSLLIQPPAYLLAAYFFLRVRHARPAGVPLAASGSAWSKVKAYAADVAAGAKLVLGDGRLRWVALAFVLPQIVHRVFENLLIPVFAKTILHAPQSSAWLLTASNLGELVGAVLLLNFAARFKGPTAWVKYGALGLLLIWALASTTALPVLLPLILVSSLSWAASDLSLRSEIQRTIPEKDQPRALSFLYGAFVLGSAAVSFGLGGFMDYLGMGPALYWICGGISALALAVFLAARRIKR
jgi:MFS family permease